jgi:hypothetical protein
MGVLRRVDRSTTELMVAAEAAIPRDPNENVNQAEFSSSRLRQFAG